MVMFQNKLSNCSGWYGNITSIPLNPIIPVVSVICHDLWLAISLLYLQFWIIASASCENGAQVHSAFRLRHGHPRWGISTSEPLIWRCWEHGSKAGEVSIADIANMRILRLGDGVKMIPKTDGLPLGNQTWQLTLPYIKGLYSWENHRTEWLATFRSRQLPPFLASGRWNPRCASMSSFFWCSSADVLRCWRHSTLERGCFKCWKLSRGGLTVGSSWQKLGLSKNMTAKSNANASSFYLVKWTLP